jgi:hypothetical protein
VARAKRTDRTNARRRNRAALAAVATEESGSEPIKESRGPSAKAAPASGTAPRPSIVAAFKGAYHPLDLRGDLRSLPVVFSSWGFLVAVGVTVVLGVWIIVAYSGPLGALPANPTDEQLAAAIGGNTLPALLWQTINPVPPAIGAFLIGFAAKRASWLGGLVYGLLVVAVAAVIVQTPARLLLTGLTSSSEAVILGSLVWSPIGAALFAALAAWYRRFLDLSNPNRLAQRQRQPPKQGRGNMKPARR